jgi:SAM-dependent methyltransferase
MTIRDNSTTERVSFDTDYFERLYANDEDPWRFASSIYERRKYAGTLEILRGHHLGTAFEVGCSIGILTRMLAPNCDSVLAVDISRLAVTHARRNCLALRNVTIARMRIPGEWPAGQFDLILLSEVLYFLGPEDIRKTASQTLRSLSSNGRVLLVNWLGKTDYPCGGDEATSIFLTASEHLRIVEQRRNSDYRLDLLVRERS